MRSLGWPLIQYWWKGEMWKQRQTQKQHTHTHTHTHTVMGTWRQRSVSSSEMIEIAGKPSGAWRESWNWFSLQVQEETNPADFGFELLAFIIVRMNLYCLSHTCLVSFKALKIMFYLLMISFLPSQLYLAKILFPFSDLFELQFF